MYLTALLFGAYHETLPVMMVERVIFISCLFFQEDNKSFHLLKLVEHLLHIALLYPQHVMIHGQMPAQ